MASLKVKMKRSYKRASNFIRKKWVIFRIWYDRKCADLVLEFCNQTNIHGFQQMANPAHVNLKIGWIVFCFLCMLIMYFALGSLIKSYSGPNVSTSISMHKPDNFPTILFCPHSWIDYGKTLKLMKNVTADGNPNSTSLPMMPFTILAAMMSYQQYESKWDDPKANEPNFNLTEAQFIYKRFMETYDLHSLFDLYNLISYDANVIFENLQFVKTIQQFVRASSVCYRFLFNRTNWHQGPARRGFSYKSLSKVVDLSYHTILIGDDDSYSKLSQNNLQVLPMVDFLFSIQVSHHQHYYTSEKPCNKSKENASMQSCITNCQETYVEKTFGCSFFFGQQKDPGNYCLLMPNVTSPRDLRLHIPGNISNRSPLIDCYQHCIIPCSMTVYDPVILNLSPKRVDTKKNVTRLSFQYQNYFSSMDYDDSTTNQWSSIVANIGGMVSLCSGASFIALAHVLYHFCLRQICPRPKTVKRISKRVSESAISAARVSHENLDRIKVQVPLWKKSLMAAQKGARKIGTSMEPTVLKTREQIRKISTIRPPPVPPKIVIEPSFSPEVTPKVSIIGDAPQMSIPSNSPRLARFKLSDAGSFRRKLSSIIPGLRDPKDSKRRNIPVSTLRVPSIEEAHQIMALKTFDIETPRSPPAANFYPDSDSAVPTPPPRQKTSRCVAAVIEKPPLVVRIESEEGADGAQKESNSHCAPAFQMIVQCEEDDDDEDNNKHESVPTIEIEEPQIILDPRDD